MKPIKVMVVLLPVVLLANPIMTGVVNEFTTDTMLGQKIELHTPWASGDIPLMSTQVSTTGGLAVVDTDIIWPANGYATIDRSVLDGPFYLALDSGSFYLRRADYFFDYIFYPDTPCIQHIQPGTSVARYCFLTYPSNYRFDWYLDASSTFGSANDDYPGCLISGHVFRNGSPAEGACLVADCYDSILDPSPYVTSCTTYSQSDGSYSFDSLVPAKFLIEAFLPPYNSLFQLTPVVYASRPISNIDFTFYGIEEKEQLNPVYLSFSPNPFYHETRISRQPEEQDRIIKIYDLQGQPVKTINVRYEAVWHGDDDAGNSLPAGIYFCQLETASGSAIKKVTKVQ